MRTFFKILVSIVAVLILVFVVSIVVLTTVVNPNDYKNQIDQYVYKNTGRHLVIKGDVGLSFVPWLGVDLEQVELTNPSGFKGPNLATIGKIKVKVRFWPLLVGDVQLGKIVISKATINLIKNQSGKNNWSDFTDNKKISKTAASNSDPKTKLPITQLKIAGININYSTVNLINQQTNSITSLQDFNLSTGAIENAVDFPVSLQFTLTSNQSKNKVGVTAQTNANFNLQQNIYHLSKIVFDATLKRPHLPTVPVQVKTNLIADLNKQILSFYPLNAKIANMQLNGKTEISHLQTTPQLSVNLIAQNTDLKSLLTTLQGKSAITGQLTFHTALTTAGNSKKQLLSNLNGNGKFAIRDGAILGININSLLAQAAAILNRQTPSLLRNSNQTTFSSLTGSYSIENGILRNNDLKMNAGQVTATGLGTINLMNNNVNYRLTAAYTKPGQQQPQFEVPIIITGTLNSPSIKPDFSGLARKIITKEIEKKVEDYTGKIGKKLRLDKLFQ